MTAVAARDSTARLSREILASCPGKGYPNSPYVVPVEPDMGKQGDFRLLAGDLVALTAPTTAARAVRGPQRRAQGSAHYGRFTIARPANGETIHDHCGRVRVQMELAPALRPGHRIMVLLDGTQAANAASTSLQLIGVGRGTHALAARVTDAIGSAVAESAAVTFHVRRASRPHSGRQARS